MSEGQDPRTIPQIDRRLVALLTGEMGNAQQINKVCLDLGSAIASLLPDMIAGETGLKLAFSYAGTSSGMQNQLIGDLDEFMVLCDAGLRGWCGGFVIACPSLVITALVETLLGGGGNAALEPVPRAASKVELKMSPMLFDKIAAGLRQAIDLAGNQDVVLTKPENTESRAKPEADAPDIYATEIKIDVAYGSIETQLSIIIPQSALLKTRVKNPKMKGTANKPANEFTEQISDQVRRSDVTLEARIRLETLSLGAISRLQAGDVIPFFDSRDVTAQVNANGRDLYQCEFGRSGEQYMVRVKDTHGSEDDLLKHLMG